MRKIIPYSFTFALMKRFGFPYLIFISLFSLLVFLGFPVKSQAQSAIQSKSEEDTLRKLTTLMWGTGPDSLKEAACSSFIDRLSKFLSKTEGFSYPFDSLSGISIQPSDDGYFRIFSWDLPLNKGQNQYYGLISTNDLKVFRLTQKKRQSGWADRIIGIDDWYGCIYYKVIVQKYKSATLYTLLGWDGSSNLTDVKVIDVLTFKDDGQISLGAAVFKTPGGIKNRVVFEYAKRGNAILRYDRQSLMIQKGKRIHEQKIWMIIADHLVPMSPGMEGQFKFYVPSGDTYDGYFFSKGYWLFAENVKVGNPSNEKKK